MATIQRAMKKRNVVITIISIVVIAAMFGFLMYLEEDITRILERTAPYSHIVFFLIQFLSVILAPIPSNITATAGAMFLGPMESFLITYLAVVLGSVSIFMFVRSFRKRLDIERMEKRIGDSRYLKLLYEKPAAFLFIAFLLPVFPDDVLCYLSGLTKVRPWVFTSLVVLARPWGLLVASGVGSIDLDMSSEKLIIALILISVILLSYVVYRLFIHERIVNHMLERRKRENQED